MASQVAGVATLSPQEQELFAAFGFGDVVAVPFQCVHHSFEYHASAQPDAIAVEHLSDSITYRQLDRSANRLATDLRLMGVSRGSRVCILAQRSIQLVVGILATLKAGACYVPLDGSIVTQSTLEHVISDSGSALVLALDEYRHRVQSVPVISLDDVVVPDDNRNYPKPHDESRATDGVYVIYTSGMSVFFLSQNPLLNWSFTITGTTGKPKGVEVMHGNVTNREFNLLHDYPESATEAPHALSRMPVTWKRWHGSWTEGGPATQHRIRYGCLGEFLRIVYSYISTLTVRSTGNFGLDVQWLHTLYPRQVVKGMESTLEDG